MITICSPSCSDNIISERIFSSVDFKNPHIHQLPILRNRHSLVLTELCVHQIGTDKGNVLHSELDNTQEGY
ncbi:MAG: hypothetical protein AYK19_20800 [Theionarchaea archaeon DG-70-1]|nr:MAG: hypothetical protein AYK19_20800 [Theionarchaea archaeon DG-70-1]